MRRTRRHSLRSGLALFIALLLILNPLVPRLTMAEPIVPSHNNMSTKADYAPDEIIVKFSPKLRTSDKNILKQQLGLKTVKTFALTGSELVKVNSKDALLPTLSKLSKNPNVNYAEPNYKFYASAAVDDPQFSKLWGLQNTGQTVNGSVGTSGIDIKAPSAWDISQGSPQVVVAVIDTGVDISHPDLAANIWQNPAEIPGDGIDNDGNGLVDDVNGWDFFHNDNSVFDSGDGDSHGTHVSGTIAAIANNSLGVVGVAPKVRIMPLKFLGPNGGYDSDAISALDYAQKMGAKIASNSWGGGGYSTALHDAINNFGGVFVAAAGNDGLDNDVSPTYPSSYDNPNLISVAALDNQGRLASFSNFGPTSVDVGAPGVDVYSLSPGGTYQYKSGTSMATPHVSGIAALVLSVDPSLTAVQVSDLIKQSAQPLASLQGKTVSGGMANAYDALKQTLNGAPFVASSDPTAGAKEVPTDKVVSVTFDQPVQPGAEFDQITLSEGSTAVPAALAINNNTLTVTPNTSLNTDSSFTLHIPAASIINASNTPLISDYNQSFRTMDTVAPLVTSTTPADGTTGVPTDQVINIQFSENIQTGTNFNSITVGGQPINTNDFSWRINGTTLSIQRVQGYAYDTLYQVSLPAGSVNDLVGHALASDYSFSFTTEPDLMPPAVITTDPADNAVGVSVSKVITVTFNENVQPGLNFADISLTAPGAVPVPATLATSGNTLSITPTGKLALNTVYSVGIPTGSIQDLAGNALTSVLNFNFTTGKFDVTELPFAVTDAQVDPANPLIYMINGTDTKLHVLNFATGALSEVNFANVPKAVKLGQGQFADELYVVLTTSSTSGSIAILDRNSLTVKDTMSISSDPFDMTVGRDGTFYVVPAVNQFKTIDSYDRATKSLKDQSDIDGKSYAKMHPTLDRIYTVTTTLTPRDYHAYNISNGLFTDPKYPGGYDSPYHGDYPLNTNFAIDPTGKYLFNGSGVIFSTALDKTQDMRYVGKLSQAFKGIAFEPDLSYFYTTPENSKSVNYYQGKDFALNMSLELADQGNLLFKQGSKLVALLNPAAPSSTYVTGVQLLDIPAPAPTVASSDPANGAAGVPADKVLSVTFANPVQPGANFDQITLAEGTAPVPALLDVTNNTLTVTPNTNLNTDSSFTLHIPAGSVINSDGTSLQNDYNLSFSTVDTISPAVTATTPADGATGVALDQVINIQFSENIQAGANFNSIAIGGQPINSNEFSWSVNGSTLSIQRTQGFIYDTLYQVSLPAGSVNDLAGNALVSDYAFSFTTKPDITPPSVTKTDPVNGAVNVSVAKAVTVTFTENVQPGLNFADISLTASGAAPVPVNLATTGNTLTITPSGKLAVNTAYSAVVPANSIQDPYGNGLASGITINFTTQKFDVTELPFTVTDAEVDLNQPLIYMINDKDAKLNVLNFETGARSELNLSYVPKAIELGQGQFSDELYILLGNTTPTGTTDSSIVGSIAILDRNTLTIKDTMPISTVPFDLAVGRDGTLYVTPLTSNTWPYTIDSYDRVTKTLKDQSDIYEKSYAKFHPTIDRVYTIDTTVSPRDYYAFNVSNGLFTDPKYPGGYNSPYHGDYPLNTNFAIDPMGKYLFNGSGVIFATVQDKTQDMRYAGRISQAFKGIAFESDLSYFYTTPVSSKAVNVYRGVDFTSSKSFELADQGALLFKQGNKLIALLNPSAPTGSYVTGVQILDLPAPAPTIMASDPTNNSIEQPRNKSLTFTFNTDIMPGTAYDSITLAKTNVAGSSVPVTKSINGNVLTLTPQISLDLNTGYTVNIPVGAVQDANAIPSDSYSLQFQTTADNTPPAVASTDPTDGAANHPANKAITITFSENIQAGTGYDQITLSETGNPANQAAVTKSISGKVLTITPVGNLSYSTGYTLTIPSTAIADTVGNPMGSDFTLSFSTAEPPDLTAPTIISTDPADGAIDVPVTTPITISFSEAIKLGSNSSAITVKKGTKTVGYKLSVSGSNLIITPNLSLSTRSTYTVSIPAGAVTDLSGNSLAAAYTFSFSTVR